MTYRILLAGGTGLVGSIVQSRLATRPDTDTIALVRRGSSKPGFPVDFEQLCVSPEETLRDTAPAGIDVAISCLGTTIRTAGSQAAMFRVDHDYALAFARGARAIGARQFILITAAGAGGPGFYLRTKGAIERDVTDLRFERLDLIRPGFLEGDRNARRTLEAVGSLMLSTLAPVLPRRVERFGPISAETVAEAIVGLIGRPEPGSHVHHNSDIRSVVDGSRGAAGGAGGFSMARGI